MMIYLMQNNFIYWLHKNSIWSIFAYSCNCCDRADFAEYIPLKTLFNEVLERIPTEEFMVERCHVCQHYFNVNKDDGIFDDTEKLTHFICKKCAHSLTAWEFYQNHLKT